MPGVTDFISSEATNSLAGMPEEIKPNDRDSEREHWGKVAAETSRRLGDTVRQLSLGGLGAVWVLKQDTGHGFVLAPLLKIATGLLLITLLVDVLHGTLFVWISQNKLAIAKGSHGAAFLNAVDKPRLTQLLLVLRVTTLVASFLVLLIYVIRAL
jgi:hypothetical protein